MVKAIVRGWASGDNIWCIVHPLKQSLLVEEEDLLAAMRWHFAWKSHVQTSPDFTILFVRLDLADLKAGLNQEKRRIEVIPEPVAHEVEQL